MTFVSESIDIDVPVEQLFSLYSDTDSLPHMLSIVKHVEVLGPDLMRWDVEVVGQSRSIEAKTIAFEHGKRIRWESELRGKPFFVEMRTDIITPARTTVTIDVEFDAGGVAEKLGLAKAVASPAISSELRNAKKYAEQRFG